MDDPKRYLDPLALAKVRGLEMQARLIVEGYLSGMHKSPYHGFSVEFAQHREYVPGDDLKHLDWKVYSRTGRFYLKQYEEETNLNCWLLVDASESMLYGSGPTRADGKHVKYDYACMAAAALAYLILSQQDAAGSRHLRQLIRQFLKPSTQASHLKQIVNLLNKGGGKEKTNLAPIFHDLADRITRRGIIIVLSDFFDDAGEHPGRVKTSAAQAAGSHRAARPRSRRRSSFRFTNRRCSAAWNRCRTCSPIRARCGEAIWNRCRPFVSRIATRLSGSEHRLCPDAHGCVARTGVVGYLAHRLARTRSNRMMTFVHVCLDTLFAFFFANPFTAAGRGRWRRVDSDHHSLAQPPPLQGRYVGGDALPARRPEKEQPPHAHRATAAARGSLPLVLLLVLAMASVTSWAESAWRWFVPEGAVAHQRQAPDAQDHCHRRLV